MCVEGCGDGPDQVRIVRRKLGQHRRWLRDQLHGQFADPAALRVHQSQCQQGVRHRRDLHRHIACPFVLPAQVVQRTALGPYGDEIMTGSLPQNAAARKASPMAEGLLWYFPNALAAVAAVRKAGNDQHNPGEPMHHARGKSMDHADCIMRHLVDAGTIDTDGQRHSAQVAWRAVALLQEDIEREDGVPLPRNARLTPNADIPEKSPRDDFTIAQDPPDLPMGWLASGGVPVESAYLASFGP